MRFDRLFADCREILRLSQMDMAKSLSVSQGTISGIEHGIRKPPVEAFIRLCLMKNVGIKYRFVGFWNELQ